MNNLKNMMLLVGEGYKHLIFAHKDTGVMYFCYGEGDGHAVCVMVDANGKPLIYEEDSDE